jgi:hypothetical protein
MKKGDEFECEVCGLEVTCTSGCGCSMCDLFCCGKAMRKKGESRPKDYREEETTKKK